VFTDGVHEARCPAGASFGTAGALEVVRANRQRPAREIVRVLHHAVSTFAGEHRDDVTLVVLKVQGRVEVDLAGSTGARQAVGTRRLPPC
jgi:serine phosphatase RsbU (regulator of sigma subunit)